jgi:hypothetical protein
MALNVLTHWNEAKRNGWSLDKTTVGHLTDGLKKEIAVHEGHIAEDKSGEYEKVFAGDVKALKEALAEIEEAYP